MLRTGEIVYAQAGKGKPKRALHTYKLRAIPLIQMYVDEARMEIIYAVDYRGDKPGKVAKEPQYVFLENL